MLSTVCGEAATHVFIMRRWDDALAWDEVLKHTAWGGSALWLCLKG